MTINHVTFLRSEEEEEEEAAVVFRLPEPEMVVNQESEQGEVESALQTEQSKNHTFSSLARQSSIYSLTLDEFQNTLCDGGKNFGSMNMDEFLNSIWTAEETQAHAPAAAAAAAAAAVAAVESSSIAEQPSLPRQGSLTLPAPLCRKTVEEVWSEIHNNTSYRNNNTTTTNNNVQNQSSTQPQPQPTFGEMTLEDFLVKAGVVREREPVPEPYGLYQTGSNPTIRPGFMPRPIVAYPAPPNVVGESPRFLGKPSRGYPAAPPTVYSGGSYGAVQGLGLGSPASPVSSDGMGAGQVDGLSQFELEMGGVRGGRKRILDGPVEKVVERRQRRMIKNRESAARSRARKQAYTVELEAELNQMKQENAALKQALADLERKLKQQYADEAKMKEQNKAQKARERLRRNLSSPY